MLSCLPMALLALLFALPVFSEPTSSNDPFRQIIINSPKRPEPPICCLKPLTPLEPVDGEILLSFEEWKARQLAAHGDEAIRALEIEPNNQSIGANGSNPNDMGNGSETTVALPSHSPSTSEPPTPDDVPTGQWPGLPSYFKVPLTDRFNYASLDCSARVHTAHRSSKSPSSILSSKKDRYMLSPCNSKENQFIIVELCDDIRIDTVQLANYEFFSGVFKDFTVSVAKRYTNDPEAWVHVGTYRAKNVRGVQSFHPPLSLRDFYRVIRIDFHSHYGSEYYCPVSLLRVYGLTQLEEWKWDVWEAESLAKHADSDKTRPRLSSGIIVGASSSIIMPPPPSSLPPSEGTAITEQNTAILLPPDQNEPSHSKTASADHTLPSSNDPPFHSETSASSEPSSTGSAPPSEDSRDSTPSLPSDSSATHSTDASISSSLATSLPPSKTNHQEPPSEPISPLPSPSPSPSPSSLPHILVNITSIASILTKVINISSNTGSSPPSSSHSLTPTIIVSSNSPSVTSIPAVSAHLPSTKGGESIYRTIMNRLVAIDSNHTLYMRYIEQQHSALRDVIKRLGEDIGRLEGINRAHSLTYQRTLNDWERQKYQLEMEHVDLLSRIDSLSEEILLEKRLGIAQLFLLLAVLVFMGLTRGSRVDSSVSRRFNVREWGKRQLHLSGDWTSRFRTRSTVSSKLDSRGASRTPPPTARPKHVSAKSYPSHLVFPSKFADTEDESTNGAAFPSRRHNPLEPIHLNTAPVYGEFNHRRTRTISNPRSQAPSLRSAGGRRTQHVLQSRPMTPVRASFLTKAPGMVRSNSHGTPGYVSAYAGGGADGYGYGAAGTWTGSGHVPRSAKKWARTAHLHEVRSAAPPRTGRVGTASNGTGSGQRSSTSNSKSPLRKDDARRGGEGENEDPFMAPFVPVLSTEIGASSLSSKRRLRGKAAVDGLPRDGDGEVNREKELLFSSDVSIPGSRHAGDDANEGDAWVDTDSVGDDDRGSEFGFGVGVGLGADGDFGY